jgi:hypothetical protein
MIAIASDFVWITESNPARSLELLNRLIRSMDVLLEKHPSSN